MKISPEKHFDARSSKIKSVWQNFDPKASFWGQRSILGGFGGQKGQKSRLSDLHETWTINLS